MAEECERIGPPLIVEALSRGPGISPGDPNRASIHARVAVELGAHAIKTRVVDACPAPVLVLGRSRLPTEDAGVFFGPNVFQAAAVRAILSRLRGVLQETRES